MLGASGKAALIGILLARLPLCTAVSPLAETLAAIPDCATPCVLKAAAASTCDLTNATCLCMDEQLRYNATICVIGVCTNQDSLIARNVTETACGAKPRDVSGRYILNSHILITIAGLMVIQRFINSFVSKVGIWLDDLFIAVTLVFSIGCTVVNVRGLVPNGLGRDIWTIPHGEIGPFGIFFYASVILYVVQSSLLKLSILFFYLRLFRDGSVRARRVILGTAAVVVLVGLIFLGVAIGVCTPISHFWLRWDGIHPGTCMNLDAIYFSHSIIHIILDVWMLGIPLFQVKKLQLDWKKKLSTTIMFSFGLFITVISLLRFYFIITFSKDTTNPTWRYSNVCKWSETEICVGIICACLPSLRKLVTQMCFDRPATPDPAKLGYGSRNTSEPHSFKQQRPQAPRYRASAYGIVISRTFAVEYETDETSLVEMKDPH